MTPIEDLPANIAELIETFEAEIAAVRERYGQEVRRLQEAADREIELVRRKGEERVQVKAIALMDQLKPMQTAFLKDGKLDEALATRDAIKQLRALVVNAMPDPGNLLDFRDRLDQELVFEVVGANQGPLWGSDPYTLDSSLACAAVHAGALAVGQKGAVRVVIQDASDRDHFEGSERHGVFSYAWGPYPFAFRVWKA